MRSTGVTGPVQLISKPVSGSMVLPTGPTAAPVAPPAGATITSAAGTQKGAPNSFCWSAQIGGPTQCYSYPQPSQPARAARLFRRFRLQHGVGPIGQRSAGHDGSVEIIAGERPSFCFPPLSGSL